MINSLSPKNLAPSSETKHHVTINFNETHSNISQKKRSPKAFRSLSPIMGEFSQSPAWRKLKMKDNEEEQKMALSGNNFKEKSDVSAIFPEKTFWQNENLQMKEKLSRYRKTMHQRRRQEQREKHYLSHMEERETDSICPKDSVTELNNIALQNLDTWILKKSRKRDELLLNPKPEKPEKNNSESTTEKDDKNSKNEPKPQAMPVPPHDGIDFLSQNMFLNEKPSININMMLGILEKPWELIPSGREPHSDLKVSFHVEGKGIERDPTVQYIRSYHKYMKEVRKKKKGKLDDEFVKSDLNKFILNDMVSRKIRKSMESGEIDAKMLKKENIVTYSRNVAEELVTSFKTLQNLFAFTAVDQLCPEFLINSLQKTSSSIPDRLFKFATDLSSMTGKDAERASNLNFVNLETNLQAKYQEIVEDVNEKQKHIQDLMLLNQHKIKIKKHQQEQVSKPLSDGHFRMNWESISILIVRGKFQETMKKLTEEEEKFMRRVHGSMSIRIKRYTDVPGQENSSLSDLMKINVLGICQIMSNEVSLTGAGNQNSEGPTPSQNRKSHQQVRRGNRKELH